MRFISRLSALVLPFAFSAICFADAVTSGPRFGVIDMQRIILNVDEGKKAKETLEKEMKTKAADLQKKSQELDKLNKEWKEQSALLSEDARMKKQQAFQEKMIDFRNAEMATQNEMKQKEGQATQRIAMNVTSLIDGMARAQSLDGVFEVNSSGLLYLKNPVDLTDQVIKKYNETKFDQNKAISSGKNPAKPADNKKI